MYYTLLLLSLFTTLAFACQSITCVVNISSVTVIGSGVLNGPETIAIDSQGFLYTGINDGSIKRIDPVTYEITTYAFTLPLLANRTNCGQLAYESVCGRVLGMKFDSADNLYAVDAYFGLVKFPRSNPHNVQRLSNSSNGVPFKLTNALIIDKAEKYIYFTDTSPVYPRTAFVTILLEALPQGRLLRYDIHAGTTTTLLDNLVFGNGIAFNSDQSFIVIAETSPKRLLRYYVTGPLAGTLEVFTADLHAYPDNVEFDSVSGNFLVGCYSTQSGEVDYAIQHPSLANTMAAYVPATATLALITNRGVVKVVDQNGNVAKTLEDSTGILIDRVSEGKRSGNNIYLGSVMNSFLGQVPASLLQQLGKCN